MANSLKKYYKTIAMAMSSKYNSPFGLQAKTKVGN